MIAALAAARDGPQRSDAATNRQLAADETPPDPPAVPLVRAAVLVPLVRRDGGMTVLLTQRTAHLANHAGQISFPGGRIEADDADAVHAALRETQEEIGLPGHRVDLMGRLDDYVTGTGFSVTPVVGLLTPPFELTPDDFEVAEIFEVPLHFVLDPLNHQRHTIRTPDGRQRYYYAIPYQSYYIWGATAGMLVNLSEVLHRCCGP